MSELLTEAEPMHVHSRRWKLGVPSAFLARGIRSLREHCAHYEGTLL